MDETIRKKIEPFGSTSIERFEFLRAFRKTNASIGLHVMPIIPYITDSEENFDNMFGMAGQCKVHYVLPGTLYLRGSTRRYFLEFASKELPDEYEKLLKLYKTGGADKEYKTILYEKINRLRDKYGLSSSYMKPLRDKLGQTN